MRVLSTLLYLKAGKSFLFRAKLPLKAIMRRSVPPTKTPPPPLSLGSRLEFHHMLFLSFPFEYQVSWVSDSVKQRTAASKPHNTTTDHTVKYNEGRVRYLTSDTVYHNLESKIQFSPFCQILHFHELTVTTSRAHTQSGLHKINIRTAEKKKKNKERKNLTGKTAL